MYILVKLFDQECLFHIVFPDFGLRQRLLDLAGESDQGSQGLIDDMASYLLESKSVNTNKKLSLIHI